MLPSEIKTNFKTYFDSFSFNFSNTQLNSIFEKANQAYWEELASRVDYDWKNVTEIEPIVQSFSITPTSNEIAFSDISANYDRLMTIVPTFVVNGKTYTNPSKYLNEVDKSSVYSRGTYRYPKHFIQANKIVINPNTTPTACTGTYLRVPYPINFVTNVDVPITSSNMMGIIAIALRNVGVSQREFDYAQQVEGDNKLNNF